MAELLDRAQANSGSFDCGRPEHQGIVGGPPIWLGDSQWRASRPTGASPRRFRADCARAAEGGSLRRLAASGVQNGLAIHRATIPEDAALKAAWRLKHSNKRLHLPRDLACTDAVLAGDALSCAR
jgi:hypothetical protein